MAEPIISAPFEVERDQEKWKPVFLQKRATKQELRAGH
jgi:hypothetical protein